MGAGASTTSMEEGGDSRGSRGHGPVIARFQVAPTPRGCTRVRPENASIDIPRGSQIFVPSGARSFAVHVSFMHHGVKTP
jgi:hypothetical protein